jgi:hypothetical protein
LISDGDRLKVLPRTYHKAAGQQSSADANSREPADYTRTHRANDWLIGYLFLGKKSISHRSASG